jgi:hypothetical protein
MLAMRPRATKDAPATVIHRAVFVTKFLPLVQTISYYDVGTMVTQLRDPVLDPDILYIIM